VYSSSWRVYGRNVQDSNVPVWLLWVVRIVRPGTDSIGVGVAGKIKHHDHTVPYNLVPEHLPHGYVCTY
jgi:hypothetical protein